MKQRLEGYFGKYRAMVKDISDPEKMRRIRVVVPAVDNVIESAWALPCDADRRDWLPEVGDIVWIEFEQGDPSLPIWVGLAVAKADVDADFLAKYLSTFRKDRDPNGNYIKWTPDQGSPTGEAIQINGSKRLATQDYVDWMVSDLIAWIQTHTHVGATPGPYPVTPTDLVVLAAKVVTYNANKAPGGIFLTNKFMAE